MFKLPYRQVRITGGKVIFLLHTKFKHYAEKKTEKVLLQIIPNEIILLKTFVTTVALLILNVKNGTKSATAVNYIST
jgi:hypothetical protein